MNLKIKALPSSLKTRALGITIEPQDQGITIEPQDQGITIEPQDQGITIEPETIVSKKEEIPLPKISFSKTIEPKKKPAQESPELTLMLGLEEEDEEDIKPVKPLAKKVVESGLQPKEQEKSKEAKKEEIKIVKPVIKKSVVTSPPPKIEKKDSGELTLMLDLDDETEEEEEGELIEEEVVSPLDEGSLEEWAASGSGAEGSENIEIQPKLKKEKKMQQQADYLSSEEDQELKSWALESLKNPNKLKILSAFSEKDIKITKLLREGYGDSLYEAIMKDKKIAIRLMDKEVWDVQDLEELSSQVSVVQEWNQENLVKLYGMHIQQGQTGYLMDYNSQEAKELERIWPQMEVTEEILVQIALEILYALSYIHAQKIVHEYLNIENILLVGKKPFLLDAGLTTLHKKRAILQKEQEKLPYIFMSPEQCKVWQGRSEDENLSIDKRTDIYSLGMVMYWMLCFRFPYEDGPYVVEEILHTKPTAPAELDPMISVGLSYIVMKAIEKNPKDRYSSAQEMITDLKQLIA
ncbi:MAG: protein kinase [Candidatus Brocadiae bacterium]|nr:protein kinase [Candidatus Brocadiia bacterium]